MKKPLLELLKDFSALVVGAAAVLYLFGFIVHLAYFRLLGVEMTGQPLDYIRLAADYCTSIIGSLPQLLFGIPYYLPKLMHRPFLIITLCCMIIVLLFLLLHLPVKKLRGFLEKPITKKKIRPWWMLWHGLNLAIIICLAMILYTEFDIAKVRDILQPVDAADIQQMQEQPLNRAGSTWQNGVSLELRGKNVSRVYEKYAQSQKDVPGFHNWNNWFNPLARSNTSEERSATYLALLLLNIIALLAIAYQLFSLRKTAKAPVSLDKAIHEKLGANWSRIIILTLGVLLLFQLLVFPYVYATLGRYFTYPVVMIKLNRQPAKNESADKDNQPPSQNEPSSVQQSATLLDPNWTHGVYLIAQTDSEVVVYDRLNFFQIKHVPRAQILAINQLFNASPFESCSKQEDELIPCEMLWMPEEKSIVDF